MPQGSKLTTFSSGGMSFGNSQNSLQTYEHDNNYEIALPVGQAGTLSTRTSDTVGEATLGAAHGIETGDIVDIYWSGGVRYGVTVGTVAGTAVPFSLGAGDNLPTASTAIVMTKQVTFDCHIDGDDVQVFGVFLRSADSDAVGHLDLQDSGDATIAELDLVEVDNNATAMNHAYDFAGGETNILTGNPITHGQASNGSSSDAATLYIRCGENVV